MNETLNPRKTHSGSPLKRILGRLGLPLSQAPENSITDAEALEAKLAKQYGILINPRRGQKDQPSYFVDPKLLSGLVGDPNLTGSEVQEKIFDKLHPAEKKPIFEEPADWS